MRPGPAHPGSHSGLGHGTGAPPPLDGGRGLPACPSSRGPAPTLSVVSLLLSQNVFRSSVTLLVVKSEQEWAGDWR